MIGKHHHQHHHHHHHHGHDRDVNNAINQGGGDSWSLGSDKWKRQKNRNQTEGKFWKSHMEISWKSYGCYMENRAMS